MYEELFRQLVSKGRSDDDDDDVEPVAGENGQVKLEESEQNENAATTTLSVLAEWRELTDSSELKSKVTKPDYEFDRSVLTDETIAKNLDRDDLTFDSDEGFGIQGDILIP